jgi:hypothetical protein
MSGMTYAVTDLPDGGVRLTAKVGDDYEASLEWADQETADAHIDAALSALAENYLRRRTGKRVARRYQTRFGTIYAHLNTGPPIWRLPHPRLVIRRDRFEVGIGWLYAAVTLAFVASHEAAQTEETT